MFLERFQCRCLDVTSRDMYWDQPRQPLPFVFLGAYQRDLATTAFSHSSKTVFLPWHPASFWESFSLHNSRAKMARSIAVQLILAKQILPFFVWLGFTYCASNISYELFVG